jgi:hypothetical protein
VTIGFVGPAMTRVLPEQSPIGPFAFASSIFYLGFLGLVLVTSSTTCLPFMCLGFIVMRLYVFIYIVI